MGLLMNFSGQGQYKAPFEHFSFRERIASELGLEALKRRDLRYVFADWQFRCGVAMPAPQRCMCINNMRDSNARHLCAGGYDAVRPV